MPKLSVIIPCYFNEENIPVTARQLIENEPLFEAGTEFEYIWVDDASGDKTWEKLKVCWEMYPGKMKLIRLVKNAGAFNAILAGLHLSGGDVNVILTADLQDPPELIPAMFAHWQKGYKLIIANRQDRQEPVGQKMLSRIFHSIIRRLAVPNAPSGGFDLVLFDRKLKEEVIKMDEKNTNILYLLVWLGYEYVNIPYTRRKREIGTSRWTLSKKIKMFIDTIIAFSFFPVRLISVFGILLGILAFLYGVFIIIARLTGWIQVEGWSALMVVLLFVSAFQMIALGVLGEYVWRTMDASRKRPNFLIQEMLP
ncbi:glycosyltransferase family 2 protein [Rhodocytophaga rosea]|uniref:Glycosyltransferase family 2 protein n=1 Tax=Rhodocytophaga rosea TaxID=2704465 RepID=A0A6C0GDN2_9BACT|nr:glycosyltransferase family 2 protein [Rhodocytophaga rosea]QHT66075.1 glycosyltransferase family 2 protein [Rhodocytophaga rosea]